MHIKAVSEWGFPFTTLDMRFVAKAYLDAAGRKVKCFKNNFPSKEWAQSFLKRHSDDIAQRTCQNIKKVRACVSPEIVNKYFDNLEKSLQNEDGSMIEPSCIFNYDETYLTDDPGVKNVYFEEESSIRKGYRRAQSQLFQFCFVVQQTVIRYHHMWYTKRSICGTDGQKVASKVLATTDQSLDGLTV